MLPHLQVDLLVAQVGSNAQPLARKAAAACRAKSSASDVNRGDDNLNRSQPERERAGEVLDHHAQERSMEPQIARCSMTGPLLGAVLRDVFGVQPLGQHIVELQRPALPRAADASPQVELELRP